ncbi:MAG: helix-turn-helix domain-containing protein [Desulfomonilaceae bacterium]
MVNTGSFESSVEGSEVLPVDADIDGSESDETVSPLVCSPLNYKQRKITFKLHKEKEHTVREICQIVGISKPTLYSYLHEVKSQ